MTATRGRASPTKLAVVDEREPWCETLRTSTGGPRARLAPAAASPLPVESPVNTTRRPPACSSSTMLSVLASPLRPPGARTGRLGLAEPRREAAARLPNHGAGGAQRLRRDCRVTEPATQARRGRYRRMSAGRPPVWSACRCEMTSVSRRRTPSLASAASTAASEPDGPPSTSPVQAPLRSAAASPCPTSTKTTRSAGAAGVEARSRARAARTPGRRRAAGRAASGAAAGAGPAVLARRSRPEPPHPLAVTAASPRTAASSITISTRA